MIHRHHLLPFFLLLLCFVFSGCGSQPEASAPESASALTPVPASVSTPTPEPSSTPSPAPEPESTPAPDSNLGIAGGDYLLDYEETGSLGYEYMGYWVMVPDNAQTNLPLIVFLHGDGWVNQIESLPDIGFVKHAKEIYGNNFPFIMLIPCTLQYSWEADNIPDTLVNVINRTVTDYQCNPDKIIITGHSRGAIGTWYMIQNYTDLFSCAVPVSCSNDSEVSTERFNDLPVWGFVGGEYDDYDNYGYWMQLLIDYINQDGGTAQLTVLEGMHHGDTEYGAYTKDVFEWMIAQ